MPERNFGQYMRDIGKGRRATDNPYEHNAQLIDTEKDDVQKFSEIVDKQWLLGNVKDDALIRITQVEVGLLTKLKEMSKREPELGDLFNVLYYKGRGEFSITRNKQGEGNERVMQANASWRYQPTQGAGGYGVMQENASDQEGANFIQKIFQRKGGG